MKESRSPALGGQIKKVALASAVAQVITQGVTLGQTMVLARLLSPVEVGVFAAGTVLTAFLANLNDGGMRAGLVHREGQLDDATNTVFWGTMITGSLMSLGALAVAPVIGMVFESSAAGMVAAVSAGSLLLYSLVNVPEAMLQRAFSIKRRLIVGPAITISFAVSSISFAAAGYGVWSLVIGTYVSHAVWVIAVWSITDWRPGQGRASWAEWRRLSAFGAPLVIAFIGVRVQQMIESVVVGRGLSTEALGFYRYGTRISRVPVDAVVEVVATALFPAFSRIASDRDRLRASYLHALGLVTCFSVVMCGLILALGEPAVVVLLGEPWRAAGAAVVAMAGLGLGKAFASVSEEAVKGAGQTKLINWMTVMEFVLGVGLLVLIIPFGLFGVGLAISITSLVCGVLYLGLIRPVVDITFRQIWSRIWPPLTAAALATAGTAALEILVMDSDSRSAAVGAAMLALDVLVFGMVYLVGLAILAPSLLRSLVQTLRSRAGN